MKIIDFADVSAEKLSHYIQTLADNISYIFEAQHIRKNGSKFPVEISAKYVFDDGHAYIVAMARDISVRKATEARMQKLYQAVNQAGEAIIITDQQGIIEYVNQAFCRLTGYQKHEIMGKTPAVLSSGKQDKSFYEGLWATIKSGRNWQKTLIDKKKDGTYYPAMMSIAPIKDNDGEITHFVGFQQDMSEYVKLEEQFLQAQKMEAVGVLAGGIAHDFNNMLAAITCYTYLGMTATEDNPKAHEYFNVINSRCHDAAGLISQLLGFSRKGESEMKELSLSFFVKEAMKFSTVAIEENINLTTSICDDSLLIMGDATLLQQVLLNLLKNAGDAVADRDSPAITVGLEPFTADADFGHTQQTGVECYAGHQYAHLYVRDNGCGISEEDINHIFEPFYTTKEVGKGTGLGLAMIYGTVRKHNGVITTDSDEGNGTTFHLYFPLIDEGIQTAPVALEVREGKGETILIVDDDNECRKTAAYLLDSLSYNTIQASNGLEALEKINNPNNSVDLIVTDVVMPKMGGVELARIISESYPHTPVLFTTGYDRMHLNGAYFDKKMASKILSKPFSIAELSVLLRKMLD